ncbi:hypothetical protein LTR56_005806 [Elasticomyces elasticus]|nr:hypothetical protein LTR56_005806 [Elasticomyces elasticus]KAK4925737.1 hypothetical protein LTR49_007347 [Elasticomyces elasticus]KAK5765069.1 hypothetical protein LTS12_004847 [Elasticomyces elasticus]
MSQALKSVSHLMVTPGNPPRDVDGLDHERCAALHNAIFKHGWTASGRAAEDFIPQSRPHVELYPQVLQDDRLQPSTLAFLRLARALPMAHENTNRAIMMFDITDDLELDYPWQKLESILTVWIEMMQRGKIVALHISIGTGSYEWDAAGGFHPTEGPPRDPATGARRLNTAQRPWTILPYSRKDLQDSLELWRKIVGTINSKIGFNGPSEVRGLLDTGCLDRARIPVGSAREFLSQAVRPRFSRIAPGLSVPNEEHFSIQPYLNGQAESDDIIPPILLFRGDTCVSPDDISWCGFQPKTAATECPVGLYLHYCDRLSEWPQEDGCRLVLPFTLEAGWAKQSDYSAADRHDKLLQSGVNPYALSHPVQLLAFLERIYLNVHSGHWDVDEDGVAGGIEVWRKADTELGWPYYHVPVGPGQYW